MIPSYKIHLLSEPMNKTTVYLITFLAYVGVHTMRMSYSFAKPSIQRDLGLDKSFMGLLDFLPSFSIGLGFALKYVIQSQVKEKPTKLYLTFVSVASLSFAVFPILSLFMEFSQVTGKIILAAGLIFFGFFQFPAWPVLLLLISQYYSFKSDSFNMGFWSANGDLGNVVGFLVSTLLVTTLNVTWQVPLILFSAYAIFASILLYLKVEEVEGREAEIAACGEYW